MFDCHGQPKRRIAIGDHYEKGRDEFILFKCKEEIRVPEELLREPKSEEEIIAKEEEMLITSKETEVSLNCQVYDVVIGDEKDINEAVIKEMEDILSFEGKSEVQKPYEDEQDFSFKDNNDEGEWSYNQ